MAGFEFYGEGPPGVDLAELTGKLIVLEGTDGVGRSTQISLLKPWLENRGHAVLVTGMTRSALAGEGIKRAKEGHTLSGYSLSLFYATDFADRLENEMIPALRAGFVVLTDRYVFTLMARSIVRGADPDWIREVFTFALKPSVVYYLRTQIEHLIPRALHSTGFDYWESGMDLRLGETMFDSFVEYQTRLLAQFDAMTDAFKFEVIDATKSIEQVFEDLHTRIVQILD